MNRSLSSDVLQKRPAPMLYLMLYGLRDTYGVFNVFRYITFRTICACLTAMIIGLVLCPWLIRRLSALKAGQVIRDDGPDTHFKKAGTPTMGGSLILFSLIFSMILWADLTNRNIWLLIFVLLGFGVVGFLDDYKKVVGKDVKGMRGVTKIFAETAIALVFGMILYTQPGFNTTLSVPFFKTMTPDLGILYVPLAVFIVVGSSNAVNLTDGLDGLAIGPIIIAAATFLLFAYISGHAKIAHYLRIPYIFGAGELAVVCGAIVGEGLARPA